VIRGSFDHQGRPCVQGWLVLPRLNIQGDVEFLVDTGADSTTIHPFDGQKLGVPFEELLSEILSIGIGGSQPYFLEHAILMFEDDALVRQYSSEVLIGKPSATSSRLPSLLGRSLLSHWRMVYDPTDDLLTMTHRGYVSA